MKTKKLLFVLLAVLLVFSLFGCGEKGPVEDTEPQDTTEQEELTPVVAEEEEKQEPVELTQEELHELFKRMYDAERYAKANLPDDMYADLFLKLPAKDIGTQVDANVFSLVEDEVARPKYDGKVLPADGFEQYVAWREALESAGTSSENGGTSSGNSGSSGNDEYYENVYEGAHVEHEVPEDDFGESSVEQEYETPSYEIVG